MSKKTLGTKTGQPTKRGTWGGGFQIEKNFKVKKPSCYSCYHCNFDSCSCEVHGVFIPSIGSGMWKNCKDFLLDIGYASKENIELVKRIKGEGFVKQEIIYTDSNLKYYKKIHESFDPLEGYKDLDDVVLGFDEEMVSNVCLLCIENGINPLILLNEAECMLERYIRNLKKKNPYLKDELNFSFDLFYLKQISLLLNCKVTEILELDEKRKNRIIRKLFNIKYYDIIEGIENTKQFYIVNPEYVKACEEAQLGIFNHSNSKTGALIDVDSVLEELPLYFNSAYDEDEELYYCWITFHKPGSMYFNSRISGAYTIYSSVEKITKGL